ncbi:MAG: PadR family transcriptional regulator [Gemmatimonadota bacterium]
MNKPPTTTLGYALLGLLHQREQTGYALRKFFADSPMGNYSSSPGAIYPALRRLEEQGLIIGSVRSDGPLKRSRTYRPTKAGLEALRTWLGQDMTRRDIEVRMDELMLRFAFLGDFGDVPATRVFLASLLDQIETYLVELKQILVEVTQKAGRHGRLALEGGIESYEAHARWARRALSEFEEE